MGLTKVTGNLIDLESIPLQSDAVFEGTVEINDTTIVNDNLGVSLSTSTGTLHSLGLATFDDSIEVSGNANVGSLHNTGISYLDNDIVAGSDVTAAGNIISSTGYVEVSNTQAFYLGDPTTDGTWRIIINGTGLDIQRRESGSYITKSTITA